MGTATKPISADDYFFMAEVNGPSELVRGVMIPTSPTGFQHGIVCDNIPDVFKEFRRTYQVGRRIGGELGVWTSRTPFGGRTLRTLHPTNST